MYQFLTKIVNILYYKCTKENKSLESWYKNNLDESQRNYVKGKKKQASFERLHNILIWAINCVESTKFMCWNLNPDVMVLEVGAFGKFMNGISGFIKEVPEIPHPICQVRIQPKDTHMN